MSDIKMFFNDLSSGSKTGLLIGIVLIIALTGYLAFSFLVKDYGVLYNDLEDADASNIVAGLKKLKIDYQISDGGSSILVNKELVNEARLSLMSEGIMLNKTVGLEIFNDTDYGMTEFAQKVNFQRAMQGEIARTIMALEEIKFARVHLTLPKDSIFVDQQKQAKASIAIIKEEGQFLTAEQILGIQRLVASSVDGLPVDNVVVVDERGLDISIKNTSESIQADGFSGTSILNKKREYEKYLKQKVESILRKGLGEEQFAVSIDIEIDASKTTLVSENIVSPENSKNGYLKHENINIKFSDPLSDRGDKKLAKTSEETNNEYLYGKEVKQTEMLGGGIKSVSVAVLLDGSIDDSQIPAIQQLVGASIGINSQRGDIIQVKKIAFENTAMPTYRDRDFIDKSSSIASPTKRDTLTAANINSTSMDENIISNNILHRFTSSEIIALTAIMISVLFWLVWHRATKMRKHREKVLADISGWLESSSPSTFISESEIVKNNV